MKKILNLYNTLNGLGQRNAPLYPMVEELDHLKQHYYQRKRELDELINILDLRI